MGVDVLSSHKSTHSTQEEAFSESILKAERDCSTFLNLLVDEDLTNEESLDKSLNYLFAFLEEHKRLLYSVITRELRSISEDENRIGLLEKPYENCKILLTLDDSVLNAILAKTQPDVSDEQIQRLKISFIKIYDHVNLAMSQFMALSRVEDVAKTSIDQHIEITKSRFDDHVSRIKSDVENVEQEIKNSQKDYITILGMFASIVLAFTNGLAFNTSVLENMHNNSIYRIVFVATLLAETTIHLVYLLFDFIYKIYKDAPSEYPEWLKAFNKVAAYLILATIACYIFIEQPSFIPTIF